MKLKFESSLAQFQTLRLQKYLVFCGFLEKNKHDKLMTTSGGDGSTFTANQRLASQISNWLLRLINF